MGRTIWVSTMNFIAPGSWNFVDQAGAQRVPWGRPRRCARCSRWYHLMATREGIHHLFIINESNDFLNEDDSVFDDDDEIYVQATFIDADGGRRSQISNVVTGRF
jgi:hypothetical protein